MAFLFLVWTAQMFREYKVIKPEQFFRVMRLAFGAVDFGLKEPSVSLVEGKERKKKGKKEKERKGGKMNLPKNNLLTRNFYPFFIYVNFLCLSLPFSLLFC